MPPPQPCGTNAAYARHITRREVPCQPCRDAHAAYRVEQYHERRIAAGIPAKTLAPCGTKAARLRHYGNGERLCLECAWSIAESHRPAPCGTEAAARRHRQKRETCEACRVTLIPGRSPTRPCGTPAAVRRHEYHREPLCELCAPVRKRIDRERKERERAARAAYHHDHDHALGRLRKTRLSDPEWQAFGEALRGTGVSRAEALRRYGLWLAGLRDDPPPQRPA